MSNRKSRASALTANTQNDESIAGAFKRSTGCSRLSGSCSVIDEVGASCIAPGIAGPRRDAFGITGYSTALAVKLLGVSTCAAGVEICLI
ncbi:hypothetical protein B5V01_03800 [Mesorhizobium erdmanii]|uniref:Uncharacterized protein n=2 Tax=Mesorhizobium TaxID=68287 RepID=A0A3M9X3A6_9HYPH|nr:MULTISPECIES: hypothetical protein [Mesorhizobium]RNJ42509.1 hypothetical protein DNR46_27375 [Mesorhizobium japonicum]RXT51380.1 hypothetical protein B5V01_03800 [Mesorhizobium erdmanii]